MITSDKLEWICVLLLHPCQATLARCSQVIPVREVEAIFEVFFHIVDHLLVLRLSESEWNHIDTGYLVDLCVV